MDKVENNNMQLMPTSTTMPFFLDERFLDGFVSAPIPVEGVASDVVARMIKEDKAKKQPSFHVAIDGGFKALEWAVDEEGYRVSPEKFFQSLPAGSIATIPVNGVMMEDDTTSFWTGRVLSAGTTTIGKWVQLLDANPNVIAIKFEVNSPGGSALGNESLNNIIRSCNTLTAAHYSLMCSAAYGSFCACDIVSAKERVSIAGSIGVMITMVRRTGGGFMEQMGYEVKDVYSKVSSKKNAAQREFQEEGTTEIMEDFLTDLAMPFIESVKKSRNIKDDGAVFEGEIYIADKAVKNGLADRIESSAELNKRLQRMYSKLEKQNAGNSSANSTKLQQITSMSDKKEGLKGEALEENTTLTMENLQHQIDALKSMTGFVSTKSANERIEEGNAKIAGLNAKITSLEEEKLALTANVQTLTNALEAAQQNVGRQKAIADAFKAQLEESKQEAEQAQVNLEEAKATIEQQDQHAKQLGAKAIEATNTPDAVDTDDISKDNQPEHKPVSTTDLMAEVDAEVNAMFSGIKD